jgi:phosphatidate cytidylyltransferase
LLNIDPNRLKTGLYLLLGVIVIFTLDNDYLLWFISSIILGFSIYEMQNLLKIDDMKVPYFIFAFVSLSSLYFQNNSYLIIFLILISLSSFYAYKNNFDIKIIKIILYPILPISFLYCLIFQYQIAFLIWICLIVVLSDIGAYVVGKNIGKTPFSPTSPNKTLEGVIGALFISSIAGSFIGLLIIDSWFISFIISFLAAKFAVFGDLFESYLKRQADIKDSGDILGSHGGILDRMDGYLFAIPAFYIILQILEI